VTRSPEEGCAIARECGGCSRVSEPYRAQLAWKTEAVRRALAVHEALGHVEIFACVPMPDPWRYRNRAKLAVAREGSRVRLGLYRRGSNQVVDLAPCVVHRPVVQSAMEKLRSWLAATGSASPQGPVFYVDVREVVGGRCHVTLVVADARLDPRSLPIAELAASWPELSGVAVNFGDRRSSYPIGLHSVAVMGEELFEAPLALAGGREIGIEVPVTGFFQVSTALLPEVHRRMAEHLGADGPLYDLYCGVGVHGLALARCSAGASSDSVVGIEESEPAILAARRNATRLDVTAEYHCGRVEDEIVMRLASRPARRFVINPGRAGSRAEVLQALASASGARIAYLSCNPVTLARDLAMLVSSGLRVLNVTPLDLMPHTDHIEALALIA
jgi:23S rRNA (uracil1939-C5)-methyltransferase